MGDWQRQHQQQPLQNAQQQQQPQPQPQPQPVPSPPTDVVVNSKRQRRPSVRLGEIGDLSAAYYSHDFLKKKPRPVSSSSGFSAKIPKTSRNQHHSSSAVNLSGDEDHDEGLSTFGFKDSSALRLAPVLLNKRLRHRRVRRREIKITSDSSNRHNLQQQQHQQQPQPQPQPSNGGNGYGKDFGCDQPSNGGNCYNKGFGYDNNGSGQDKGFEYDNGFVVSCDGYKDSDIDVATSGSPTNMKEACTIHLDSPKIHDEEEEEEENDNEHLEVQYGSKQQDDLEEKMLASSSAVQYLGMVKDVRAWLSGLGLGRYAEVFEEHEVDKEVLPLLTLDDLKEMGITAVGARRKMFSAIQKLGKKFAAV